MYADPEQPGVVWFGCEETLVRYDAESSLTAAVDYTALVRRVTMKGDSLLYGGTPPFEGYSTYTSLASPLTCHTTQGP
jgi:hypothetical protein